MFGLLISGSGALAVLHAAHYPRGGRPARPVLEALGEDDDRPQGADRSGWTERLRAIGKPLLVGLAVFASVEAMAAWALVHLA